MWYRGYLSIGGVKRCSLSSEGSRGRNMECIEKYQWIKGPMHLFGILYLWQPLTFSWNPPSKSSRWSRHPLCYSMLFKLEKSLHMMRWIMRSFFLPYTTPPDLFSCSLRTKYSGISGLLTKRVAYVVFCFELPSDGSSPSLDKPTTSAFNERTKQHRCVKTTSPCQATDPHSASGRPQHSKRSLYSSQNHSF